MLISRTIYYARRLLGERLDDGMELDGPAIAGPTGARDAEASGPGFAAPPHGDDVDSPEFHLIAGPEVVMSEPDAESSVRVASESERGSRGGDVDAPPPR